MKILHNLSEIQEDQDLAVYHHLGLGDHIHCNGIINYIIDNIKVNEIILFCKLKYIENVSELYRGQQKISLVPVNNDDEISGVLNFLSTNNMQCLVVGHSAYNKTKNELEEKNGAVWCDQVFYGQLKIPYKHRYQSFKYERNIKDETKYFNSLNIKPREYVFIHQYPERGFDLDFIEKKLNKKITLPVVYNDPKIKFFEIGRTIENAKEFYCLESSLRCYVEHLDTSEVKLYLYTGYCDIHAATNKKWVKFH